MREQVDLRKMLAAMLLVVPAIMSQGQTSPGPQTQATVRSTRLAVNGRPGEAAVVQVGGRSYVEVESLARITGATLGFQGSQIVLTLPGTPAVSAQGTGSGQGAGSGSGAVAATPRPVLSREFVTAGVVAVSSMREWRVTLVRAVQTNQEVSEDLMAPYRRQSETQVALAAAAARTDPDRSAAALLQNELTNLRTLAGNYVGVHDTVTNIRTDALDTDPLSAKVLSCLQGLAGMSSGGQFQDIATCH